MMFRKKSKLSIDEMIEIENWIENECATYVGRDIQEDNLSEKLGLKVEYVDPKELPLHVEAELRPIEDLNFNGLIRVTLNHKGTKFAYIHEIMHYLKDVGNGNRVETVFARKSKGYTETRHEQEINYAAASFIMPYVEVEKLIQKYDNSIPRMDELEFVRSIALRYDQPWNVVIRRIQEVRKIRKRKLKK